MSANNIIISINTKMAIKMFATNNRIIIKESFAKKMSWVKNIAAKLAKYHYFL